MVALSGRCTPIDLLTLGEELRKATEFEQVGGATYIASLIDYAVRIDDISHYAKILRIKALERRLHNLNNSLTRFC
jgi:replicative DNA helicase